MCDPALMFYPFLPPEAQAAYARQAELHRISIAWEVYRSEEREIIGAMLGVDGG